MFALADHGATLGPSSPSASFSQPETGSVRGSLPLRHLQVQSPSLRFECARLVRFTAPSDPGLLDGLAACSFLLPGVSPSLVAHA